MLGAQAVYAEANVLGTLVTFDLEDGMVRYGW